MEIRRHNLGQSIGLIILLSGPWQPPSANKAPVKNFRPKTEGLLEAIHDDVYFAAKIARIPNDCVGTTYEPIRRLTLHHVQWPHHAECLSIRWTVLTLTGGWNAEVSTRKIQNWPIKTKTHFSPAHPTRHVEIQSYVSAENNTLLPQANHFAICNLPMSLCMMFTLHMRQRCSFSRLRHEGTQEAIEVQLHAVLPSGIR